MRRVLTVESWNPFLRFLRVFAWTKDFGLATMNLTKVQCWAEFMAFH